MNLGNAIVSTVIRTGSITPFLAAGMDLAWVNTLEGGSVFTGQDKRAYRLLVGHWNQHSSVNEELFRKAHPAASYRLTSQEYKHAELIDEARDTVRRFLVLDILNQVVDMDEEDLDGAIRFITGHADRLRYGVLSQEQGTAQQLSDFDFDTWVNEHLKPGIPLGIPEIDEAYGGFQPGQLITLVGRQKSTKSTLMGWSAIAAWEKSWEVMFYNVELDLRFMRQKMLSIGAHTNPERLRRGPGDDDEKLWKSERRRLGEFYQRLADEGVPFWVSQKYSAFTVDDVRADIERYHPHAIYIDGFYFMEDKEGDSASTNWKAIEHIAADLKALAMEKEVAIIISTQAQEKQQGKKKTPGIEARTIQGGTGLLKASDLVLGLDLDDRGAVYVNDVRNRYGHVDTIQLTWNWDEMKMDITPVRQEFEFDNESL